MGRWKPGSWSHSSIDTMLNGCPYQLALDRLVGLPSWDNPLAAIGTAYHAGIQLHEEFRRDGHEVKFDELLWEAISVYGECNVRYSSKVATVDEAHNRIEAALTHWWEDLRPLVLEWTPLAIEIPFALHLTHVTMRRLTGIPDVVYRTPDGDVLVVDNKAATDMKRYPEDGSTVRPQAGTYARAVRDALALPPVVQRTLPPVEFHIARSVRGKKSTFQRSRIVSVQPTEVDVAEAEEKVRQADQSAALGQWDKNPAWILCRPEWCPHHEDAGGTCDPQADPEYDLSRYPQPEPVSPQMPGGFSPRVD